MGANLRIKRRASTESNQKWAWLVGLSSLNLSVAAFSTERAWYRVPSEVVTWEVSSYALISLIFDGVFLFTIFELGSLVFEIKNKAHSSRVRTKRVWLVVECGSIQYSKTHTILGPEFILKGMCLSRWNLWAIFLGRKVGLWELATLM